MQRVLSEVLSNEARKDPSACIIALNPLMDTTEGRRFLSKQVGEGALMLIELFDWALKFQGNPFNLNKGCMLWTLRQLCATQETLPRSCILPIDFEPSGSTHAAGGFADVWKGVHEERDVAFKSLRWSAQADDKARLKRKRRFCKEVILWKSLNHSNILGLIGVCRWDNTPDTRLTMVSEWMPNGNITEYIKRNDSQRMQLLVDCAKGVEYIHRMRLVHGDLKGANILITSDNPVRACVADFGFTTIVYDDINGPGTTSALGGGTTPFMAPELLCPSNFGRKKCEVSREADVYAFGMVILQVLTGLMPFHSLRDTEISYKVIKGDRPVMPTNADVMGISEDLWQLLARCWHTDSAQRPQIGEILQHLSNDPSRTTIFPPSNFPSDPSNESLFESGTQKYGDMFVTANTQTPVEDCPPFPIPTSPAESAEYSSSETRNSASLVFSVETQGFSLVTSPGNSQVGIEEPKPPESETPSRMVSTTSDSTVIVADSTDVPEHDHDENQHDPTIGHAPRPVFSQDPSQGGPGPAPLSDSLGGKPRLQIMTVPPVRSKNSDSPGTAFYTPGGSGEVVERGPFDSAVQVRVTYSPSVAPFRRVIDVLQPGNAKHKFPVQRTPVSRSGSNTLGAPPRHGLRMSLVRPPRSDAGSSRFSSGATIVGYESGPRPGSGLAGRDEREDVGTSKDSSAFPRPNGKPAVPRRDGNEGITEDERVRVGKERDDRSFVSTSTEYVAVSVEAEQHHRDTTATPQPSSHSSLFRGILTKLGVCKTSKSQDHVVVTQAQKKPPTPSISMAIFQSIGAPMSDYGRGRERRFSGFSSILQPGSAGPKKSVKRSTK